MTGYPHLRPLNTALIPPPKHPDITHYPKWSKTRDENIEAFRNFMVAQNLNDDLAEFDHLRSSLSDIHWAMVAERFVSLHWTK